MVCSATREAMPGQLCAADVGLNFVNRPYSKAAASPVKNGEYLACGLPLVTTAGIGDYSNLIDSSRVGVVVDQSPKRGYLSAYDRLLLVVTKATQGVIPNLVGRNLDDARLRLKKLKLEPRIQWGAGTPGTVLEQRPRAGLAAAPGVKVTLVVARARGGAD